jgi:hypothetical protein
MWTIQVNARNNRMLLEVHGGQEEDAYKTAYELLVQKGFMNWVNQEMPAVVASEKNGMPQDIRW